MASPFLEAPASAWVASNALAFAIEDGFPVSPGHTLIVPRRLIATWFDATPEERVALFELVDEVKRALDERLHPDGYNIGINAGEAAGQTVPHLHVHVIPRYRGDVDDPRGGVRHVIPGKGNYLPRVSSGPRRLATGGEEDPFFDHLAPLFAGALDVAVLAAFVQGSGLERLEESVFQAARRGARVRLITGDYLYITQARALFDLMDWAGAVASMARPDGDGDGDGDAAGDVETEADSSAGAGAGAGADRHADILSPTGSFEARVVETATLGPRSRSFHPKSWRFEGPAFGAAFVGSSNVSRSALGAGIEWNLRVDRHRDPEAYQAVCAAFEHWWAPPRRRRPLGVPGGRFRDVPRAREGPWCVSYAPPRSAGSSAVDRGPTDDLARRRRDGDERRQGVQSGGAFGGRRHPDRRRCGRLRGEDGVAERHRLGARRERRCGPSGWHSRRTATEPTTLHRRHAEGLDSVDRLRMGPLARTRRGGAAEPT